MKKAKSKSKTVRVVIENMRKCQHVVIMDQQDLRLFKKRSWSVHPRGLIDHRTNQLFHRVIMGVDAEHSVIHKNRNRLDCRKVNLVVVTRNEGKARKKRPFCHKVNRWGGMAGISIISSEHNRANGRNYFYRYYQGSLSVRGRRYWKRFNIERFGAGEAKRLAIEFRAAMMRKEGLVPHVVTMDPFGHNKLIPPSFSDIYGGNADYADASIDIEGLGQISHVFAEVAE